MNPPHPAHTAEAVLHPVNVQALATGDLMQRYRETLMAVARAAEPDPQLVRESDQLEEEVLRRMCW